MKRAEAESIPTPLIETRGLRKSYGPETASIEVLRGVDLTITPGERIAILGKSGSGKSTLLHLLGGLDIPTAGSILVGGHPLSEFNRDQRADYRLRMVGMIFQAFYLVPSLSAWENVALPLVFAGIPRSERRWSAQALLERVALGHRLHHRPAELSGGERQRVAIARALIQNPALLLADEPTGNLDSTTAADIMHWLQQELECSQRTLVLVTHDQQLARQHATRIIQLQDGRVVQLEEDRFA